MKKLILALILSLITTTAFSEPEWNMEKSMKMGQKIYKTKCASCHQPDGTGIPNVFPAIAGSLIVNGDVDYHIDIVMNGSNGTPMIAFVEKLSDKQIAAVITYQRNAFGNNVGDVIDPKTIAELR